MNDLGIPEKVEITLRVWQSLHGKKLCIPLQHSEKHWIWSQVHFFLLTLASYLTTLSLSFLICKVGLKIPSSSMHRNLQKAPFPILGPFDQRLCVARTPVVDYLMGGTGEITFCGVAWGQGIHSEWESGTKKKKNNPHLGQPLSLSPWEFIWTMDSVSFPSKAFAYFTVLTSWLKDPVKLHTSSDGFSPWVSTLKPTWWFFRAHPN